MINKTITFGRHPEQAGVKDAVHVAIVSVRAGQYLEPGTRVSLNEHREAVGDSKGFGLVDPFLKKSVQTGDTCWVMMDAKETGTVRHIWDHEQDFTAPERETKQNEYLLGHAKRLGVSYKQLMDAVEQLVYNQKTTVYAGTLTEEELEEKIEHIDDFWYDWKDETGYEFDNMGSECCPEYEYPETSDLFRYKG